MNRNRRLHEISEKEFNEFRAKHPQLEEKTNELRTIFVEKQERAHLTWYKPRAVKQFEKYFLVMD